MYQSASSPELPDCHRVKPAALLIVFWITFSLLIIGCATVGGDFPTTRVSEIRIGKTTQDEIRTMFGSPWRVGLENGQNTWTYGKYRYGILGNKEARDLVVRFDDRDVVTSYTYSTTGHGE